MLARLNFRVGEFLDLGAVGGKNRRPIPLRQAAPLQLVLHHVEAGAGSPGYFHGPVFHDGGFQQWRHRRDGIGDGNFHRSGRLRVVFNLIESHHPEVKIFEQAVERKGVEEERLLQRHGGKIGKTTLRQQAAEHPVTCQIRLRVGLPFDAQASCPVYFGC